MELVEVFVPEIVKKKKSELVVYKKKDFKKSNIIGKVSFPFPCKWTSCRKNSKTPFTPLHYPF